MMHHGSAGVVVLVLVVAVVVVVVIVAVMVVESEEDSYELYRNRFIIRHTTPPPSWSKVSPIKVLLFGQENF